MSKTIVPLFAVLLAVVVGLGLMLGGFFEPSGEPEPADIRVNETPRPRVEKSTPGSETPSVDGGIETSRFSAARDQASVRQRLDGESTGIVAEGVVLDPNGAPLADAQVALIHDVSQVKTRPQDGELLLELTTTEDGRFAFENLEMLEAYIIRASHQEYTTVRVHPIEPRVPSSLSQRIQLEVGVSLKGNVVDSSRSPVAGAEVSVYDLNVSSLDPRAQPERHSLSNPDGTYTVSNLKPGLKRILVRKAGYSTEGRNGYNLADGETSGDVNFILGEGTMISGVVLDRRSGQPVPGALVNARVVTLIGAQNTPPPDADTKPDGPPDRTQGEFNNRRPLNSRVGSSRAFHVETQATDEEGRFRLNGLLRGRYILSANAKGYETNNGKPVKSGDENVEVKLLPSPRINGTVVDDLTGEPVTLFSVASSNTPNPAFIPRRSRQRFEDPGGRFTYVDLRPGTHYLVANADGYAGGRSEPVTITAEEERRGIVIRLVKGCRLSGLVTDGKGEPISGARISLDQPATAGADPAGELFRQMIARQMRKTGMRSSKTGEDGRWTMENVLGGTYILKVEHPEFTNAESSPIQCPDSGELQAPAVTLTQGGGIAGVVRKEDGTPDTKATVMISSDDPRNPYNTSLQTGPDGRFRVKGLKPGSYRVIVAQRNGEFDLLKILQSRNDPGTLVTVEDGATVELER